MTDPFDILDGTVEDLHDLPEFKAWPNGSYLAELTSEVETVTQNTSDGREVEREVPKLVFNFKEVIAFDKDNSEPPHDKAKITLRTYLVKKDGTRNEYGEGQLKLVLSALKDLYPEAKTNRELIEQSSGTLLALTTKIRRRKDEAGEIREENQLLTVLDPETLG